MGVIKQMRMKILTVVHYADLFQLALQAESLSKFWLGNKRWTIVIEDSLLFIQQRSLDWCKKNIHIEGWHIDFIIPDTPEIKFNGWIRQQQFKLYYSAHAIEDWVLVLDAKNFLIRPTDESFFFRNGSVLYIPSFSNKDFFNTAMDGAKKLLKINNCEVPGISSITPWVFNKAEVLNLITKLGIDINHWPMPSDATEFTLYWLWSYQKFSWTPLQFVTGFWQGEYSNTTPTSPSIFDVKEGARTTYDLRFWTHHRYSTNPVALRLTVELLEEMGLSTRVVNQWKLRFEENLDNDNVRIHQEFLKNRHASDPGFDPQWYASTTI